MSKIFDILLRSVMGIILAIAAIISGIIVLPFLLIMWIFKIIKYLVNRIS